MIVVDTHIIIWHALQPELLTQKSVDAIDNANKEDGIIFCRISLWEIAMLMKKQRLQVEIGYQAFIKLVFQSNRYVYRELSPEIAELSTQLPPSVNKDPADRIIAATSIFENVPLVTAAKNLRTTTSISTIW